MDAGMMNLQIQLSGNMDSAPFLLDAPGDNSDSLHDKFNRPTTPFQWLNEDMSYPSLTAEESEDRPADSLISAGPPFREDASIMNTWNDIMTMLTPATASQLPETAVPEHDLSIIKEVIDSQIRITGVEHDLSLVQEVIDSHMSGVNLNSDLGAVAEIPQVQQVMNEHMLVQNILEVSPREADHTLNPVDPLPPNEIMEPQLTLSETSKLPDSVAEDELSLLADCNFDLPTFICQNEEILPLETGSMEGDEPTSNDAKEFTGEKKQQFSQLSSEVSAIKLESNENLCLNSYIKTEYQHKACNTKDSNDKNHNNIFKKECSKMKQKQPSPMQLRRRKSSMNVPVNNRHIGPGGKKIDMEGMRYVYDEEDSSSSSETSSETEFIAPTCQNNVKRNGKQIYTTDESESDSDSDIDIETVSDNEQQSPILEARDVNSLLEQFEAETETRCTERPSLNKMKNTTPKIESKFQKYSRSSKNQTGSDKFTNKNNGVPIAESLETTICHQKKPVRKKERPDPSRHRNIDSLPEDLLQRMKQFGKRKPISVIDPIPSKKRGRHHFDNYSRTKVVKTEKGDFNSNIKQGDDVLSMAKRMKSSTYMARLVSNSVTSEHNYCASSPEFVNIKKEHTSESEDDETILTSQKVINIKKETVVATDAPVKKEAICSSDIIVKTEPMEIVYPGEKTPIKTKESQTEAPVLQLQSINIKIERNKENEFNTNGQPKTGKTLPTKEKLQSVKMQLVSDSIKPIIGSLHKNIQPVAGNAQVTNGGVQPIKGNVQRINGNFQNVNGKIQPVQMKIQSVNGKNLFVNGRRNNSTTPLTSSLVNGIKLTAPSQQKTNNQTPTKTADNAAIRNQPIVKNADGKLMVSLLKSNTIRPIPSNHVNLQKSSKCQTLNNSSIQQANISNKQHFQSNCQTSTNDSTNSKRKLNLEEYKKRRDIISRSNTCSPTSSTNASPDHKSFLVEDEKTRQKKHSELLMKMAMELLKTKKQHEQKVEKFIPSLPEVKIESNQIKIEPDEVTPEEQAPAEVSRVRVITPPPNLIMKTLVNFGTNTEESWEEQGKLDEIKPILENASVKIDSNSLLASMIENIPKVKSKKRIASEHVLKTEDGEHGENKTIVYLDKDRPQVVTCSVYVQTDSSWCIDHITCQRLSLATEDDGRTSRTSSGRSRSTSRSRSSLSPSSSSTETTYYRSPSPVRRRRKRSRSEDRERIKEIEERRVVYVGRLCSKTTKEHLINRFEVFGDITKVSMHYRSTGDHFGFVTFRRKQDAYAAVEHGNENPNYPEVDLSFGGRRVFCGTDYSDLDNMHEEDEYFSNGMPNNVPYDYLLRDWQLWRQRIH